MTGQAATQVLTHLPWLIFVGGRPGEGSRAVMMGLAWIINAVLAEYVIRTRFAAHVSATSGRVLPVLLSTT